MNFIFRQKTKTPQELVKNTRDAILKLESGNDKKKVNKMNFNYNYNSIFLNCKIYIYIYIYIYFLFKLLFI